MNKNKALPMIKSLSLDSLNVRTIAEHAILSSTKHSELHVNAIKDRRKAIIPTPHRPIQIHRPRTTIVNMDMPYFQEPTTSNEEHDEQVHFLDKLHKNNKPIDSSLQQRSYDVVDTEDRNGRYRLSNQRVEIDNQAKGFSVNSTEERKNEMGTPNESFDEFIIQNFPPFSGNQNVEQWLDETEKQFNHFRISRDLRFEAIPLLVEGEVKRRFIKKRKEIHSFDDFYEFLLIQFDHVQNTANYPTVLQSVVNTSNANSLVNQTETTIESHQLTFNQNQAPTQTIELPKHKSTTVSHLDVTNSLGTTSAVRSKLSTSDISILSTDQTLSDLRRAIVGTLIKSPKIFKGGKDNVKKWIEEMEHLFDIAHIPDTTKMEFVSYSLRGDALEWYRNNRSLLTSWKIFIHELKKAFTSTFHEELAFKKLEAYTQCENQSVRNFFNEVLRLCKEADYTMSEATKLKHLLNKTKPSIQLEVRKKKPITTAEFLEYAREVEELIQLSNLSTDTTEAHNDQHNNNNKAMKVIPHPASAIPTTTSFSSMNSSLSSKPISFSDQSSKNVDNHYRTFNKRNTYNAAGAPPFPYNPPSYNRHRFNNNKFRPTQQSVDLHSVKHPKFKKYQPPSNNSSYGTYDRQGTVNAIRYPTTSTETEPSIDTISSPPCYRCQQFGHEASVCPNF